MKDIVLGLLIVALVILCEAAPLLFLIGPTWPFSRRRDDQ